MSARGRIDGPVRAGGPRRGMVLAAGLGLRMRPITATIPKPLISVAGRTLLDRAIDRLEEAGVEEVVVNVHYLGAQIERHLQERHLQERHLQDGQRARCIVSFEPERLETGGGVARALPLLGTAAFFVVNSDIILLNGPRPALVNLAAAWDETTMDALLLLHRIVAAPGYEGAGDFFMGQRGRLRRRQEPHHAPYLFTGVQMLHPRLFACAPKGAFSLNVLYDHAIAAGRLYGLVHDGQWFHVGQPQHIEAVAAHLDSQLQSLPLT
jgi:N-acetyl-alpha-D-muramate 1-phosphate uridylyltransferase